MSGILAMYLCRHLYGPEQTTTHVSPEDYMTTLKVILPANLYLFFPCSMCVADEVINCTVSMGIGKEGVGRGGERGGVWIRSGAWSCCQRG